MINSRAKGRTFGTVQNRLGAVLAPGFLLFACVLSGCVKSGFRLNQCDDPKVKDSNSHCTARFFNNNEAIAARDPAQFPRNYLELYRDLPARKVCKGQPQNSTGCQDVNRTSLSDYFNSGRKIPKDDEIGVALEGGGSKAAPFDLGTLAGLQEMNWLEEKIGAVASVSGGSYAASYLYNRWYDRLKSLNSGQTQLIRESGTPDEWFRSCIPEYFIKQAHFDKLRASLNASNCEELSSKTYNPYNEFGHDYQFMGHVLKNQDLLMVNVPKKLRTPDDMNLADVANLGFLLGQTALTVPFQLLSRTVFRWPLNSAPSKLAYKLGLERQYGYTPSDWEKAGSVIMNQFLTTQGRRKTRSLENLKKAEIQYKTTPPSKSPHIPLWILISNAPGSIEFDHWLNPAAKDPIRQQFELTSDGYGSGTYGYARQGPDAPFDILGQNPEGLPIVDGVIASAAFFDDDQTLISQQPFRVLAGAAQHFLNITWFSELRNFNQTDENRWLAKILPWPAYFLTSSRQDQNAYIHLQDGGNSENTGIFPLLRRGYKTILYAHGTEDEKAEFEAICHLKNQLELDGTYSLVSDDFEKIMDAQDHPPPLQSIVPGGRAETRHLDAICSSQLDASDELLYEKYQEQARNGKRWSSQLARLYCNRLGYKEPLMAAETQAVGNCPEYAAFSAGKRPGKTLNDKDLFFKWPMGTRLTFKVYRNQVQSDERACLISNIITVVPAISFKDVLRQTSFGKDVSPVSTWDGWIQFLKPSQRRQQQINWCYGPNDKLMGRPDDKATTEGLPCTALAHVLDDVAKMKLRPQFPQTDFIIDTLHQSYTSYAAYFDLARHEVQAVLKNNPDYPPTDKEAWCRDAGR